MYLYIVEASYKFRTPDYLSKKFLGIVSFNDSSSRKLAIDLFHTIRKQNKYAVAYESLNATDISTLCPTFNFKSMDSSSLVSIDFDVKPIADWDSFASKLRKFLTQNAIHSDLQHSPHGYHLIVNYSYVEDIRSFYNEIIKLPSDQKILRFDSVTVIKMLDTLVIDDFEVFTEEHWT